MTPRHMALAAAIMALQAAALYLISSSSGHAGTVYRCGTLYQAQPCAGQDSHALQVDDTREALQVKQAQASMQQQQRWLTQTEKSNRAWARRMARQQASAVALSCIETGQRPFEGCKAQTSARGAQTRPHPPRQRRQPGAERPFVARVPDTQLVGVSSSVR
ncbi:MAG TPA: hypothetical protein VFW84_01815 [Aquabacterium sp.]|uniref:hypothetical protein n=1 Tax=Aquabacterium sp. TaxID=1872578 RepID=UPI002E314386|nr:hypothetical protein [Aquabacterium sp.]HEX5371448.1 hypothetical protein [Aquabacterium sp.]